FLISTDRKESRAVRGLPTRRPRHLCPSPWSPPSRLGADHVALCPRGELDPFLLSASASDGDFLDYEGGADEPRRPYPLVYRASRALRASSWFSWWSQLILTVISAITFLFAKNVLSSQASSPGQIGAVAGKFALPGLGIAASSMSIAWTWGQRRLARRFLRRGSSRVEAANLLRRVIQVGTALNLAGLLTSVLGAQYIVGTLVAKSMQGFVGFGGGGGIGGAAVAAQTLQPLDVLVVQANTNVLSSHFVSLACLLWLTRMVDLLDPPSLEEDDSD
ncbi:hypothetical protein ACHAWF_004556, partial [Thalassiosira exigua]